MSQQLQAINELQPIAKELRERQEHICSRLRDWNGITADLVVAASEQGRSIILAKTKLGHHIKFSEWLNAHVPNLHESQAAKYERIATEQLRDPRQCVFAFLPPAEREAKEPRTPPKEWEIAWGYIEKLKRHTREIKWPKHQIELTRNELSGIVESLGGHIAWR